MAAWVTAFSMGPNPVDLMPQKNHKSEREKREVTGKEKDSWELGKKKRHLLKIEERYICVYMSNTYVCTDVGMCMAACVRWLVCMWEA